MTPAALFPVAAGSATYTLIDVRAPVEVAGGAVPSAVSLPILTDDERHLVGARYAEAGPEAARRLGFELVTPTLGERVAAWRAVIDGSELPTAMFCWRGGDRSLLATEFLAEAGAGGVPRVQGGYKAIRAHLTSALGEVMQRRRLVVLGGLTGAGKTRLLRELQNERTEVRARFLALDLEGVARHRGSAFGALLPAQPSQQTFENELAATVILDKTGGLLVEDESRYVGVRSLPDELFVPMSSAPVVRLEAPLSERATAIYEEYVVAPSRSLGRERVARDLADATRKLKRRLGTAGAAELAESILALASSEEAWADAAAHAAWIGPLLEGHYDPLYEKAAGKLARPVVFRGDASEVKEWLLVHADELWGVAP